MNILDSKGYKYTGECGLLKVSWVVLIIMKRQKALHSCVFFQGSIVIGDVVVSTCSLTDEEVINFGICDLGIRLRLI